MEWKVEKSLHIKKNISFSNHRVKLRWNWNFGKYRNVGKSKNKSIIYN